NDLENREFGRRAYFARRIARVWHRPVVLGWLADFRRSERKSNRIRNIHLRSADAGLARRERRSFHDLLERPQKLGRDEFCCSCCKRNGLMPTVARKAGTGAGAAMLASGMGRAQPAPKADHRPNRSDQSRTGAGAESQEGAGPR